MGCLVALCVDATVPLVREKVTWDSVCWGLRVTFLGPRGNAEFNKYDMGLSAVTWW